MSLKKFLSLSLLLLCAASLWAVPARRSTRIVEQPDGTRLTITMQGDERFHYVVTIDGIPIVRQGGAYYYAFFGEEGFTASELLAHEPTERTPEECDFIANMPDAQQACAVQRQRAVARRGATRAAPEVPTHGEVRVPVLLVQYTDKKFSSSDPKNVFEERINGENYTTEGGCGSIRDYFVEQSGGKFNPHFDIIGPITLKNDMAYYGGNDKDGNDLRPREMVKEACIQAYSIWGTDFKRYDNNKDGYVDIVYVIYAGYGEASYPDKLDDTIWPHQWQLEEPHNLNGVLIDRYACNNELDSYTGTALDGIGTFCHEFSHCLGLPDFYDTSGSSSPAFGMNCWSLMDYGCYNNNGHTPCGYNAYEKHCLGWYTLVELKTSMHVILKPLSEGGEAYKIVNDANPDEFYVVEQISQEGWNKHAPASGMMVLHVDYQAEAWAQDIVNNDPNHQRVTIIPADGRLDKHTLDADVYPGRAKNRSLTATSHPAAKVYTGGYMNKDITQIFAEDGATTFTFTNPESRDWFTLNGATYRIVDAEQCHVVLTGAFGGNGHADYNGHFLFGDSVRYRSTTYAIVGIEKGAFSQAKELRSVMVANSLMEHVGDSLFHGCRALNAVVWDVPLDLPDKAFDAGSYRNLLVYLPDTAKVPTSLDGLLHAAVVKDGYCDELTLDAEANFYCPRNFTAGHVAYSRTFKQTTGLGTSSGWETLVLPFDVQRITHATKGDITPFGIEGNAHCWLATPKDGAFTEATEIRANTPYILSMPNNEAYGDHSLAGGITFSAEEAEIHATPSPIALSAQAETTTVSFTLVSTYDRVGASDEVYALNVGTKYGSFAPGSVFTPGRYDTPPFSVYLMLSETQQAPPYYRIAIELREKEDEEEDSTIPLELSVTCREGYLYIMSPNERIVTLYDAVGRLVQVVRCKAGTTVVGPLDEGVYIVDKTKIYVDR